MEIINLKVKFKLPYHMHAIQQNVDVCVCLYRMLYWTDWSTTSPAIYRSSVVNPAREMLVNGNLTWPNALTIDFSGK